MQRSLKKGVGHFFYPLKSDRPELLYLWLVRARKILRLFVDWIIFRAKNVQPRAYILGFPAENMDDLPILTGVIKRSNEWRNSDTSHKRTHCDMFIKRSQWEERDFACSHTGLNHTHACKSSWDVWGINKRSQSRYQKHDHQRDFLHIRHALEKPRCDDFHGKNWYRDG